MVRPCSLLLSALYMFLLFPSWLLIRVGPGVCALLIARTGTRTSTPTATQTTQRIQTHTMHPPTTPTHPFYNDFPASFVAAGSYNSVRANSSGIIQGLVGAGGYARVICLWGYAQPHLSFLNQSYTVSYLQQHPEAIYEYSAAYLDWSTCDGSTSLFQQMV